ncbi:auxin-responsive protein IAA25-like [Typha angustifolia]|uniref:auxin-responsive protein IAA25-like n=1 Tax=Typha angustifolia TaxID=59011 RepID=UPI003C2C6DC9
MNPTLLEPLREEEGGGDGLHENRGEKEGNGFKNHLELRLGISLEDGFRDGDGKGGEGPSPRFLKTRDGTGILQRSGPALGGAKRSFSETGAGFVHPWSLAARQEKAALEQAQKCPMDYAIPRAMLPPPPVVGWPPLRTSRRNLASPQLSKLTDAEKDSNKMKSSVEENMSNEPETRSTMFVKVNLEGCAVGRKIDLKAHDSYDSLSRSLQKMFHNFLSADYLRKGNHDEQVEAVPPNYVLLYEDNEGDRMLVGDVPWRLFMTSVKRLYITQDPRAQKCG